MSHERSTVSNHFIQIVTKDLSSHCQLLIMIRDFVYLYLPMEIPTHWGKTALRSTKHFDFDAIVRRFSSFHSEIVTQAGQGPTAAEEALAVLTYITLLMALSTTMSSLVLTQEIAAIPVRAARSRDSNPQEYGGTSIQLLTRFNGGQTRWTKVMGHRMCLPMLGL